MRIQDWATAPIDFLIILFNQNPLVFSIISIWFIGFMLEFLSGSRGVLGSLIWFIPNWVLLKCVKEEKEE